jgi:hypothetical protein
MRRGNQMGVSSIPSLVLVGGLSISISDNYSSKKIPVETPDQRDKTVHLVISVGL